MKERKYFLFIQNQSIANFRHIKKNVGVKVFLPSYITTDRFKKISTESEIIRGETPELCMDVLKNKYKDYDIFYLNISYISDDEHYKYTNFVLSQQPDIAVAFVCVPKNYPDYKERRGQYIMGLYSDLESYYNDGKNWLILVIDEKYNILDRWFFFLSGTGYFQSDKKFLEKCKSEYGIPESEIRLAKHIMNTKNNENKIAYELTPEFMKKVRQQLRETQKDKKATK